MKVYILEEIVPYDGSEILAVFDSEVKATKSAQSRVTHILEWTTRNNEFMVANTKPNGDDFDPLFCITSYEIQ